MKNLTPVSMIMQELQSLRTEVIELKSLLIQQHDISDFETETALELVPPEIAYMEDISKPVESFDYKVTTLLKELGIPAHFKGYHYLRYGIKLVYQDEKYLAVTKLLYPELAVKFNSSYGKVERAIRYAIETSWFKHKAHPFYTYQQEKPTNAEFIADVVDMFKLEEEQTKLGAVAQL